MKTVASLQLVRKVWTSSFLIDVFLPPSTVLLPLSQVLAYVASDEPLRPALVATRILLVVMQEATSLVAAVASRTVGNRLLYLAACIHLGFSFVNSPAGCLKAARRNR